MLRDLTGMTGTTVDESDDVKVTRHYYARSSDVKLVIVGAVIGAVPGGILSPFTMMWSLMLVPVGMLAAPLLFSRRRSRMGETHENRWERLLDARRMHAHSGLFVIPGDAAPFRPLDVDMVMMSARPLDPRDRGAWDPTVAH